MSKHSSTGSMSRSMSYERVTESVNHPLLKGITDKRLHLFTGGHFASQNLSSILERDRIDDEEHVKMRVWSAPGESKPGFKEATRAFVPGETGIQEGSKEYKKGDRLGPSWTNHWVHVELNIPESFQTANEPVIFEFDPECEALIFTPQGKALHAITGGPNSDKDGVPGNQEDRRVQHVIPQAAVDAGKYEVIIEVSCNGMFGLGMNGYRHQRPDPNRYFNLAFADIVLINSEAVNLELDFEMVRQVAQSADREHSSLSHRALRAANEMMNAFRASNHYKTEEQLSAAIEKCRRIAARVLGDMSEERRKTLCTASRESGSNAKMWAIGHCHIDTAWLWSYSVTQQKIARSWSTQIDLMRRFPNHQFAASSAQQYAWLEELYPDIFEDVTEMVKADRFIPVGGAWIEHDCILPSGESLCRQYLYGQRYFENKFGMRSKEAWLPDTFGYASQLPQILRLAGMEYFFTQKLSWNNINSFPHSTFNWVSLDGTQVLAHMTPVNSYNSQCNYVELVDGVGNNKNLGVTDECLLLFGNGDGGGGPTPRMLSKLERISALATENPEVPNVKIGKPSEFFDSIAAKTRHGRDLATWRGELYFELHRGTYTSQADIKRGNRFMEKALRDLEYYGTLASLHDSSYRYPKAELDAAWKDTMLGQFHDVLPGTSIRKAIDDTLEMYKKQLAITAPLIQKALDVILPSTSTSNGHANAAKNSTHIAAADPVRLRRCEVVSMDQSLADVAHLSRIQLHPSGAFALLCTDESGNNHVIDSPEDSCAPKAYQEGDSYILENAHFRFIISNGRITSLVDLIDSRELILAGSSAETGGLMTYDDFPLAYDAWDAEIYHLDCSHVIAFDKVEIKDNGPLRASLLATAKFGDSTVVMTFSLDAVMPDVDPSARSWIRVETSVDWHETHTFLKFALPVDIHSTAAVYDTQYGLIDRPTHRNTTVDQAKFEVVAHRFADLSETGYGIALVADHKYGYAVEGNVMRLSLLRSSTAPDPQQDMGHHEFSFAIMPHTGRLVESTIPEDALRFTNPPILRAVASTKSSLLAKSKITITGPRSRGIVLDAIKRGEDDAFDGSASEKTLILRLYEGLGGRARGRLTFAGVRAKKVSYVNILEEDMPGSERDVKWSSEAGSLVVDLDVRGFEIKTLKVVIE